MWPNDRQDDDFEFPPISSASEDGLLMFGGDLSPPRLLAAYRRGIFLGRSMRAARRPFRGGARTRGPFWNSTTFTFLAGWHARFAVVHSR